LTVDWKEGLATARRELISQSARERASPSLPLVAPLGFKIVFREEKTGAFLSHLPGWSELSMTLLIVFLTIAFDVHLNFEATASCDRWMALPEI
jgi:hypothetical protein